MDIGIVWKQKYQIALMAFPAMILASMITGGLVYALYADRTWTPWQAWLCGIINSATDPVAVVALLKDLGASKTLGLPPPTPAKMPHALHLPTHLTI